MNFVFQHAFYCHVYHRSLRFISYNGQRKRVFTIKYEFNLHEKTFSHVHLGILKYSQLSLNHDKWNVRLRESVDKIKIQVLIFKSECLLEGRLK